MKSYRDYTIEEYARILAADSHIPGGGNVGALCALLASSLVSMTYRISKNSKIKKIKSKNLNDMTSPFDTIEEINKINSKTRKINKKIGDLRANFMDIMDEDSKAFDRLMQCYKLSNKTLLEKEYRKTQLQYSYKKAAKAPYDLLIACEKAQKILFELEEFINKSLIADVIIAKDLYKTAINSALQNIKANTLYMEESEDKIKYEEVLKKYGEL